MILAVSNTGRKGAAQIKGSLDNTNYTKHSIRLHRAGTWKERNLSGGDDHNAVLSHSSAYKDSGKVKYV
jgi:hypothetical protein